MRLDRAFEEKFWIPEEPKPKSQQDDEEKLIHRRGIYKDTVDASHRFADYQLRPNMCVAMAVVRIYTYIFELLTRPGAGVGSLAIFLFFFFAFLWTETNSRFLWRRVGV